MIHFYRRFSDSERYDEIRYDSHQRKKGQRMKAPHFHLKVRTELKDHPEMAIEEIKGFIDNQLKEFVSMKIKRTIFESSESGGPAEIVYSQLSMEEIDTQIKAYEKYGMPFSKYKKQFSSADSLPWEFHDFNLWENLTQEKAERLRRAKKQPSKN